MAYATVTDMINRFGAAELTRLTTPEGQDMAAIDTVAVERAIAEASGLVDSYLRTRYEVPLVGVPIEITGAACTLARYSLAMGENREPTEQMRLARKETIDWLSAIGAGRVTLNGAVPASTTQSGARTSDRCRPFNTDSLAGW